MDGFPSFDYRGITVSSVSSPHRLRCRHYCCGIFWSDISGRKDQFASLRRPSIVCSWCNLHLTTGLHFWSKTAEPLGSFLALLSGFFQAASFICARKSAHISVAVLTFSSLLLAVFMSLMPPLLPMVHAAKWQIVVAEPWKAMSLVLILLVLSTLSIALPAAGATRCPAAVSATVFTSSCMVSGYVSQIIFFKEVPGILTLLGAASMLLSVVLMALPALPEKSPATADGSAVTSMDDLSRGRSFDSFDSLGSFVASEVSFNSTLSTLRRRETFQMMEIAEQIGAAMPVAST